MLFRKTLFVLGALFLGVVHSEASANAATHQAFHRYHHGEIAQRAALGQRRHGVHIAARFAHRAHVHRASIFGARQVRSARSAHRIRQYVGPGSAFQTATSGDPSSGSVQVGRASYYGGGRTASGGHVGAATCAHRTLPFGTRVLVTNLVNQRQAVLTVTDRGPFARGRVVDVSVGAAGVLGMLHAGVASVRLQVVGGRG